MEQPLSQDKRIDRGVGKLPVFDAVEQQRIATMPSKTPIYFAVTTLRDRKTIEGYLVDLPKSEYVVESCKYHEEYGNKKNVSPEQFVRDSVISFVYQGSPYSSARYWDLRLLEANGQLNEKTKAEQADLERKAQEWDKVATIWVVSLEKVLPSRKAKVVKYKSIDHPTGVLSSLSSSGSDYNKIQEENAHAYAKFLIAQSA